MHSMVLHVGQNPQRNMWWNLLKNSLELVKVLLVSRYVHFCLEFWSSTFKKLFVLLMKYLIFRLALTSVPHKLVWALVPLGMLLTSELMTWLRRVNQLLACRLALTKEPLKQVSSHLKIIIILHCITSYLYKLLLTSLCIYLILACMLTSQVITLNYF